MQNNQQEEQYVKTRKLGNCAYGYTHLVRDSRSRRQLVVKEQNMKLMPDQEVANAAIAEAKIIKDIKHPNLVSIYDVQITRKNQKLQIYQEYADRCDLSHLIQQKYKKQMQNKDKVNRVQEVKVLEIFAQVCNAVHFLHQRDSLFKHSFEINSRNVFLMKNGVVKLGGFGVQMYKDKKNMIQIQQLMKMGITQYYAPETLTQDEFDGQKVDMWFLGVLLYEQCCLVYPFRGENNLIETCNQIINGNFEPINDCYSQELRNLVFSLLSTDPEARPSINDVMKLPIIKKALDEFEVKQNEPLELQMTLPNDKRVLADLVDLDIKQEDRKKDMDDLLFGFDDDFNS